MQMAGLLPRDVLGVAADAFAIASASIEAAATTQPAGAVASCSAHGAENELSAKGSFGGDGIAARGGEVGSVVLRREHLEQALSRVRARTATEAGAPQVNRLDGAPRTATLQFAWTPRCPEVPGTAMCARGGVTRPGASRHCKSFQTF